MYSTIFELSIYAGMFNRRLIHNTGECCVKESEDEVLIKGMYKALVKEGLHLRIEGLIWESQKV